MKGLGQQVSGAFMKMMGGSSSHSQGSLNSFHTPEPTPSPNTMDYEAEQEQNDGVQAEQQAEAMEIDEEDAPYLKLQDDRDRQDYAILKN